MKKKLCDMPLLGLLLSPLTIAADTSPPSQPEPLDEVIVQGSNAKLTELRDQIVELEDRFYARYNTLNTIDDFDIYCQKTTHAGSKLKLRTCRVVYESKALQTEARSHLWYLQRIEIGGQLREDVVVGAPPPPAVLAITARRKDFRKTMVAVTTANPELVDLLREREKLAQQYDKVRRKLFGLKPRSG
jgi:hypothetical protein